jgi:hypothetical protein
MNPQPHYRLYGHIGSPYSMKMRAVLRYRQLPHTSSDEGRQLIDVQQRVKVPVIPVLEYPDGSVFGNCALDLVNSPTGRETRSYRSRGTPAVSNFWRRISATHLVLR